MPRVYLTKAEAEYARLLRTIKGTMKSKAALAKEIGMDRSTLTRKLNGESPLTVLEYMDIAEVLSIPKGEL